MVAGCLHSICVDDAKHEFLLSPISLRGLHHQSLLKDMSEDKLSRLCEPCNVKLRTPES
jgi:hypothetical protein